MAGHPHRTEEEIAEWRDQQKDDRVLDGDPLQTCEGWRCDRRIDMRCAYDAETDFLKTCDALTLAVKELTKCGNELGVALVMERLRKKW